MIGQILGHYRIESKIGEGGMGVVYRAVDMRLDRTVALKMLPGDAVADPERKRRFVQEARAASALNHPNITHIYDVGHAGDVEFIAMEYVEGKTLDRLIPRKGLSVREALKYAIQVADALTRAHAAGIVHRDLKPANVMVTPDGVVKVLDFGLAKLTARGADIPDLETTLGPEAGSGRTVEGMILGTVAYMSPEQAQGKQVDARSDVFSFGSMLCEMVTGQRPFSGENSLSTLAAILNLEPTLTGESLTALPRDLQKIIARCLRKDPARRVQTMADLKVALEDVEETAAPPPLQPQPRSAGRWAAALAAGLVPE